MVSPRIQEFVEKDLSVVALPPDLKKEAIENLEAHAGMEILAAARFKVPEEKKDEFEKILEINDPSKIDAFLLEHVPEYDQLVADTTKAVLSRFKVSLSLASQEKSTP